MLAAANVNRKYLGGEGAARTDRYLNLCLMFELALTRRTPSFAPRCFREAGDLVVTPDLRRPCGP